MVQTRRSTRRTVQGESSSVTRVQAPKASGIAPTRRTKRKAIQETAQQGRITVEDKSKKRTKKEHPSYLQRSHDAEHDPNQSIRLLNLPRDIFDEITTLLEPDSLACLSLTCKEIMAIIGRESWIQCRSKRRIWDSTRSSWTHFRHSFISLLSRDTPHLTFCDVCTTLHPPLKPPREHREMKLTKHCFGQWSIIDYLPSDELGQYNLLWEHILEARESLIPGPTNKIGSPIELLDGSFTMQRERLTYTLNSSGRQVGKNLVLKHEHIFRVANPQSSLPVADILSFPVPLCPHQTTSTKKPEQSRYTTSRIPSGLLTHSIAIALPSALRAGISERSRYISPPSSEKKQMDSVVSGVNHLWKCRACPTKWRVQHNTEGAGELKITAYHSLGDTAYRAQEYWKMLVRRETSNLGSDTRNSEFFVVTRQYLDFAIGED
ncbi:hypothetical protein BP6252_11627 [Coleophoma cylindrospora]|uniref:F-box domain-containing protein n=1 Tax=Coleophoma cylindrospora TaxID=1849047 RepID=A0A3D8QL56_9HELO|nr:hypothetical protein BP6252_11627 [Coleophoma cylindrospora]